MQTPTQNIAIVNNTGSDIRLFETELLEAYRTGKLDAAYIDVFALEVLPAYNPNGTDRMLVALA